MNEWMNLKRTKNNNILNKKQMKTKCKNKIKIKKKYYQKLLGHIPIVYLWCHNMLPNKAAHLVSEKIMIISHFALFCHILSEGL